MTEAALEDKSPQACGPARRCRKIALGLTTLRPGGGEMVVAHLARSLPAQGVQAEVICLEQPGQLAPSLIEQGVKVHALNSTSGYDLRAIHRLRRLLRGIRPDVVNIHDRASLPYFALANLCRRCPLVYTAHGLLFNAADEPSARYRLALRFARSACAVSPEVADRHTEVLGWRRAWNIIPNGVPDKGVDPSAGRAVRGELGLSPETFVLLAMGNVREEKGVEDLLDAADALGRQAGQRSFVVLLAGRLDETDYCRRIRNRHEQLGLGESVRFLGYRTDGDALRSAADAFVLSSRSEGLPMVVLEAMMAGLPIVATEVGGVPEALADGRGLLVPARDPARLAEAMGRLLTDEATCRRLGQAARREAEATYSVDRMAREYLRVYEHALAGRSRPGGGA